MGNSVPVPTCLRCSRPDSLTSVTPRSVFELELKLELELEELDLKLELKLELELELAL
jgi:hypothetical protein